MTVINQEELEEIVEVVWMTALELSIIPGDPTDLALTDYMTSEIRISGAWNGAVTVRCSEDFLAHAAARMFGCKAEDLTEMDLTDSLTELTNMLGGTVKCLFPETCDLSLPTILSGDENARVGRNWVYFACAEKPLAVAVEESADDAQQAA